MNIHPSDVVIIVTLLLSNSIHAQFDVIFKSPNTKIAPSEHQFMCQINTQVNRPQFHSFIRIYHCTSPSTIVYALDVSMSNSQVKYVDNRIIFNTQKFVSWIVNDEYYITFDEGVLFSNGTYNSTALNDSSFWHLTVVNSDDVPLHAKNRFVRQANSNDSDTTTSIDSTPSSTQTATTSESITSSGQTTTTTEFISTSSNGSMTSDHSINTSTGTVTSIGTMTSIGTSTTTGAPVVAMGESPPTRSAQLGMGLGITLIAVLLIGEVIYFKYFYQGPHRSANYLT